MIEMKKVAAKMTAMVMIIFAITVMLFVLTSVDASALTQTLEQGVRTEVNFGTTASSDTVSYYKIKPTKTGFITFNTNDNYSGYVILCDSNKKAISKYDSTGDWLWGGSSTSYFRKIYFGVKKGRTYYIRVKGYSYDRNDAGEYVGSVKWTNTSFKAGKHGSTKKRSKAMSKNKTVKGLFVAGSKKGHWYKITNKQKTTKIYFKSPRTNGALKVKVYYQSYGKWYDATYYVNRGTGSNTITGTISRKVKHTYYLKVFPDKKSSGNYTLKWK